MRKPQRAGLTVALALAVSGLVAGPAQATSTDWDGDGIPNSWETAHRLDPRRAADAAGDPDPDRDRIPNEDEDDATESCAGDDDDRDRDGVDDEDENDRYGTLTSRTTASRSRSWSSGRRTARRRPDGAACAHLVLTTPDAASASR